MGYSDVYMDLDVDLDSCDGLDPDRGLELDLTWWANSLQAPDPRLRQCANGLCRALDCTRCSGEAAAVRRSGRL